MNYRSTKFFLACFCIAVSAIGLFNGSLDGGTWVAAMSLVLGLYGAADVAQKHNSMKS